MSQITIDMNDMPFTGDTIRISTGQITAAIDPLPTGTAFTWDFSQLQWITQTIDTFLSISQTAGTYQFIFADVAFNPNRANLATRSNFSLPPVGGIQISNTFSFYYKNATQYRQVGFGANLNGFDTPMPYNSKDIIYNFPLNYNNNDSSDADFSLAIPNVGYYGYNQHRVNIADGWGTLITPYGTFNTLRVKSTITAHDTLHLDSLNFGFGINRPVVNEYKWLAKNKSIPLLQINTTLLLGNETVTSITYRDSARNVSTGINELPISEFQYDVFPNPVSEFIIINILSSIEKKNVEIFINDLSGKKLFQSQMETISKQSEIKIDVSGFSKGLYFLSFNSEGKSYRKKFIVN